LHLGRNVAIKPQKIRQFWAHVIGSGLQLLDDHFQIWMTSEHVEILAECRAVTFKESVRKKKERTHSKI